jgi:hypothetical protein
MSRLALCTALATAMFAWTFAAKLANAADKTHTGKVVSVTEGKDGADGKLVMTDNDGKNEHTHMISSSVKITLDKKSAKLGELKKGDSVTVTTDDKTPSTVKEVSAARSAK